MPVAELKVELDNVTEQNLLQLKTLNMTALPVRYTDDFYHKLVANSPPEFLKFAYWHGFAVGAVCSRLEPSQTHPGKQSIYIMTIAVLPAYRRRGIATVLLNHIIQNAVNSPTVVDVYLNVQISNEEARQFYLHNGFEQTDMIENYYKRIDPPHCYVLRKAIER